MPLTQLLTFPVAFRSDVDGMQFRLNAFFVLIYVIMPHLATEGPVAQFAKYLLSIALMLSFALVALTRQRINLSPLFPLAPLLLSVLGVISLVYSVLVVPGTATYSSALVPLIVAAIPLLIPTRTIRTDGAATTEYLLWILGIAGLFHVMWQLVQSGWTEGAVYYGWLASPNVNAGVVVIFFMLLCGLFRRNLMLVLSFALIVLSELLRPASTMAFLSVFAAAVIVLHRLRCRRFLRLACILIAAAIILGNLVLLESNDVAEALYSIEPAVKQDMLGGYTNEEFRVGVLSAARDEMDQLPLLAGKAFIGNMYVDPAKYLPGLKWGNDWVTFVPPHSDFIIMILQGGLIGYGLFAWLFIGMALLCAKAARLAHAARDGTSETLFDALQAMNVAFMFCISGNPMLADVQSVAPYLMLIPLAVFLARTQPGFAGRRHIPPGIRSRGAPISGPLRATR